MSEQLEDQIALCISQRRNLEAILNSVTDGILAIDRRSYVVNLNQAAQEITGLSQKDAVGRVCSEVLQRIDGEAECVLARALEEEEVLQNCEVDIVRPDGSVRTLLVTVHSLQDELGSALGVVAILKDQTELRALQTALNGQTRYERLVGKNHRMREIYQLISDIGDSDA
ncbi:MAG: PAS domain S-box protein, partial [Candidatus Latescibacteria bacterium]|nr:PAS domain S-box protein [Candidatus Latescibacterota bacterium]